VKKIGFDSPFQQTNVSCVSWWCDLVNKVVSSRDSKITSEQAISELLKSADSETQVKPVKRAEPTEPEQEEKPNPPPDADFKDI
jgi:hypothetical protein